MKEMMVIREPSAFQLLADETRRKMLYLLRVKEMNVNQLAKELGLTSQAVYHHIKKLQEGKMVEVVREERIGHLIESYYRATAEDFLLSMGKLNAQTFQDRQLAREKVITVLNAISKLGWKLDYDDEKALRLVDLKASYSDCCSEKKVSDVVEEIWNMDELAISLKSIATDFTEMLMMTDKEFEVQQETRKKIRDLLLSMGAKKK